MTYTLGITGATGNLGRRLLSQLAEAKSPWRIRVLVRDRQKLPDLVGLDIEIFEGDITDPNSLAAFVVGLDACVHLASLVGYARPAAYRAVNEVGTDNLCAALASWNPQCRLVHCSSIAVLRRSARWPFLNTDYCNSKYAADQVVQRYRQQGLQAQIIYPGLIYGPEDRHFIPTLSRYLRRGNVLLLTGGERHCPAIFIDDLCDLFCWVLQQPASQADYIGVGPQELGIHDFIAQLAARLQVPAPKRVWPKAAFIPLALLAEAIYKLVGAKQFPAISRRSVDLLSIELSPALVAHFNAAGWQAKTPAKEGLARALHWCAEQKLV